MSFAPSVKVKCDVFFERKNDRGELERIIAGQGVDPLTAERLINHPDRPKGSRFVCKIIR